MCKSVVWLFSIVLLVGGSAGCHKEHTSTGEAVATQSVFSGPRLVILGFDGVDPRRVETLIQQGRLPHVAALGKSGFRGALRTTNPPQSPVAWSAFATGMGAGRHGIFDFIGRDLRTLFPKVATTEVHHAEVEGKRVTPARVENLRQGPSFWDVIARAGVPVRTLSVPYAYPPPPDGARSLGGLGTPDVRGTNSVYTRLMTEVPAGGASPAGGQIARLESIGDGAWQATIRGPRLKIDGTRTETTATVVVRSSGGGLEIDLGGRRQVLKAHETGEYATVAFVPTEDLTLHAATRATVLGVSPPDVYLEPLSIVADDPYLPLSSPPELALDLWRRHGPFKTVGWVHDTSALGGEAMDEAQFLREAMATMQRRAQMTLEALAESTDRLFISVFTAPDRIGHTFYRYIDPRHPAPRTGDIAANAAALAGSYDEMDRIIGEVVAKLRPADTLLVMSDHGFGSFRRGFHLNHWLVQQGYLAVNAGVQKPRDFFQDVDWTRTRAYGMGTGSIFLNLKGREPHGIVEPRDAHALAAEIAAKVRGVKDGKVKVVIKGYLGDDLYAGPKRREAPDVRVALIDGYRASWETTLGGIPATMFSDNTKKWSGDHASADPKDVPGILFANRKVVREGGGQPRIEDFAATAYAFCDVAPPPGTIGSSLLGATPAKPGAH